MLVYPRRGDPLDAFARTARMKPSNRIRRANRREPAPGVSLGTLAIHAVAWFLAFVGWLQRRREAPKARERLSTVLDERYRAWARGEAAG